MRFFSLALFYIIGFEEHASNILWAILRSNLTSRCNETPELRKTLGSCQDLDKKSSI